MPKSQFEKLVDAGVQFAEVSRKQAESVVSALVSSGDVRRNDAERLIQTIVERGRRTSDMITKNVQKELDKQIATLSSQFAELEANVDALAKQVRSLLGQAEPSAATAKAPAKPKPAAKKAPAKPKAAAKKAPAKPKAAAKKAPANPETAAEKTPAVGSSGVRRVRTSRGG